MASLSGLEIPSSQDSKAWATNSYCHAYPSCMSTIATNIIGSNSNCSAKETTGQDMLFRWHMIIDLALLEEHAWLTYSHFFEK